MKYAIGLKCNFCNKEYELSNIYTCVNCHNNLEVVYDYDKLKKENLYKKLKENKEFSVYRYFDFLPIKEEKLINLQIGWTPLYKKDNLKDEFGVNSVYIKDDGKNPSCSFKDRAGFVIISKAKEFKKDIITSASTGNAASSLSTLAAAYGIKTNIFVPKRAPEAKIAQLLIYGSNVIIVDGNYDEAFDLCIEASSKYGWYNRNTGYNPYTREGKKTCSYEIVEQFNLEYDNDKNIFKAPDKIFVSVGDGNIISGIFKGFVDFYNSNLIDKIPKIIACQSTKSNAISKAFKENSEIQEVDATTIADSISVNLPRDGKVALNYLKKYDGDVVEVTDEEILESILELARKTGVFAEPAGACCYAGLKKYSSLNKLDKEDNVVLIVTGNGLKDIKSPMSLIKKPLPIKPDINLIKG
jgi:threonine synthase